MELSRCLFILDYDSKLNGAGITRSFVKPVGLFLLHRAAIGVLFSNLGEENGNMACHFLTTFSLHKSARRTELT